MALFATLQNFMDLEPPLVPLKDASRQFFGTSVIFW
jgi:hypothetical protein